jgi:hypothetical protein
MDELAAPHSCPTDLGLAQGRSRNYDNIQIRSWQDAQVEAPSRAPGVNVTCSSDMPRLKPGYLVTPPSTT